MEKVLSRDGTSIAYHSSGTGAPLVLVHGTGGTSQRWAPVLPLLEKHFAVYAMDRRGRGESGDGASPYSAQREFEDVAAVVDAIGTGVHLFGHSYGAVCALEASLLTDRIDRLILYEPPIPLPGPRDEDDGVLKKLEDLLAAGERAAVLDHVHEEDGANVFARHKAFKIDGRVAGQDSRGAHHTEGNPGPPGILL